MSSQEVVGVIWLTMAISTLVWGVVQIRMAEILLDHERLKPADWAAGIFVTLILWPVTAAGLAYDAVLFHRALKEKNAERLPVHESRG